MRLSDAEWTVMRAVWASAATVADGEVTAREIHDRIGDSPEWAYTTVRTLLARLVEKGALGERKRGNQSFFSARISCEDARSSALRSLVERAFDGTLGSLVLHLVARERLSKRDRDTLVSLLDESDDGGASRAAPSKGAARRTAPKGPKP